MQRRRDLVIAGLVVLASRLATLPRSLWEFDEPLFIQAIGHYEPLEHHPPPPGYPVFIALAELVNLILRDPFISLVILSLIGTMVGFVALAVSLGRLAGNERIGLMGSLLFYFSPVMLVHSVLPISDPVALGLLFLTLWAATKLSNRSPDNGQRATDNDAVLFAALAALTIGCRPQFAVAVLPMLLWMLIVIPWRHRLVVAGAFGVSCLVWFVPLVVWSGGLTRWWGWLTSQASYFAAHDAAISRGGRSWIQILFRFVAHPWGPKWLSLPLLLAAAFGTSSVIRFRLRGVVTLAALCGPYLIFALLMMDPADGPRYALPSLPLVALLAAFALERLRRGLLVLGACGLYGLGAAIYVAPFIMERIRSVSPPVAAAQFAVRTLRSNAVIAYELPLWPHAQLLLADFTTTRVHHGMRDYSNRVDVPVFIYADGEGGDRHAHTFRWRWSDAYGKLTRNHYRVVSIIPLPPAERYRPLSGVYHPERTVEGEQWRWLDQQAELELPDLGAKQVIVTLGLPRDYPFESNEVEITVNGNRAARLPLQRGKSSERRLELPAGRARLGFLAVRAFVPAERPGTLSRDPRRIAVQLLRIRQL